MGFTLTDIRQKSLRLCIAWLKCLKTAHYPMKQLQIDLPWFPSACKPNSREHWAAVAKAKRNYRHACWAITKEAMQGQELDLKPPINLKLTFIPPNRHAHDLDNLLAAFKAGLDGISDAIKIDDSLFTLTICKKAEIGGIVKVLITQERTQDESSGN